MSGISFIIPVYNGAKTLRECLDAILGQELDQPFEVIVVDNGSTDETPQILSSYSRIQILEASELRNRSRARNIGAGKAKFSVLAFIDCDVVISRDWASTLLPHLHGPIAAVQTIIRIEENKKVIERYHLHPNSAFQTLDSCALMLKQSAFQDIGGFEEKLQRWEDSHLTMKLMSSGYSLFVKTPSKATKYEDRNLWHTYKRIFESGRAEGEVYKAWFPEYGFYLRGILNLRLYRSLFRGSIHLLGQLTAKRSSIPPLKSRGGWTVINENIVISKYLNLLVAPDFICLKSLSNNVIHTIDRLHPGFDGLIKKVYSGEDFWDDLFIHIPEDPLILKRNNNGN